MITNFKKLYNLNLNYKSSLAKNKGKLTFLSPRKNIPNKKFLNIDFYYFNFCKLTNYFLIKDIVVTKKKQIGIFFGLNGPLKGYLRYFPLTMFQYKENLCNFTLHTGILIKGNIYKIKELPLGSTIHHVEKYPKSGAVFAKIQGTFCTIIEKNINKATLKLPSSNIIYISLDCFCILGVNAYYIKTQKNLKKAGNLKLLGKKSKVRGVAKNAVDHPHGGGEGKSYIGRSFLCTPLGKNNKGIKTRKKWKN